MMMLSKQKPVEVRQILSSSYSGGHKGHVEWTSLQLAQFAMSVIHHQVNVVRAPDHFPFRISPAERARSEPNPFCKTSLVVVAPQKVVRKDAFASICGMIRIAAIFRIMSLHERALLCVCGMKGRKTPLSPIYSMVSLRSHECE